MLSPDGAPSLDISHDDPTQTSLTDSVDVGAPPVHTLDAVSDNNSLNVPSDSPIPTPPHDVLLDPPQTSLTDSLNLANISN